MTTDQITTKSAITDLRAECHVTQTRGQSPRDWWFAQRVTLLLAEYDRCIDALDRIDSAIVDLDDLTQHESAPLLRIARGTH